MEYIQITFTTETAAQNELLIALMSDVGFEGFEEKEPGITAVVEAPSFDAQAVADIATQLSLRYTTETVAQQNWNAIWEAGFKPVVVPGFCTVRAAFHPPATATPYEIVITPKMSFGTGHHATTFLMMDAMRQIDFNGKEVLDFGTGTGILAILAVKLGAAGALGIDNDEWSIENAQENGTANDTRIDWQLGTLDDIPSKAYHVILANINRNILLQYMDDMGRKLSPGGQLLVSGILEGDQQVITAAAAQAGMTLIGRQSANGWLCLSFGTAAH